MKSFVPWFYLIAAAGSQFAYAANGLDAYRQGDYSLAAQALLTQAGKDPIADYYMGRMRLYGYGQLKNNSMALRYFTNAAEKGILPAQQFLARYYLVEEKNPEKALVWFKKAADQGDIQAQMYSAAAYMFGLGTKENSDTARKYYIEAAKGGNAIAQYTLGMYFLERRDQNSKKLGSIWLAKAAEQGDVNAQAKLGALYATGSGVARDNAKAVELLTKAASRNSSAAMVTLGEMAIKQNQLEVGRDWLTKAATSHDVQAELSLARLYLDQKRSLYDPQTGFTWMLQAAQNGSGEAQQALAQLYKEGKGVVANQQLAEQWQQQAKATLAQKKSSGAATAEVQAALWLSNGKSNAFVANDYNLGGIYNGWQNPFALKENNYNAAPKMELISRAELYKPNFTMVQPSEIPINDYFDLIAPRLNANQLASWTFPRYSFNKQIEDLLAKDSLAVDPKAKESLVKEDSPDADKQLGAHFDYFKEKAVDSESKANYQAVLSQLYGQAILGNSSAQFEIGQLYQYGIAVAKSPEQAITYYQLAAAQQDVRAEYNLGVLYLEGQTKPVDYKQGVTWMTDAAFKGDVYAQYALANMYANGFTGADGTTVVEPNLQQALAMYYLAASNGYGPAEYRLAEHLVKQKQGGLSVAAKQNRTKLIRRLYQGAVDQGVTEANLPLAYYNAMDASSPEKQTQALNVAKAAAKEGNGEAAILLGMMYERGIAVPANHVEALYWYQQAALNPVNAFILGTYYSQGVQIGKDEEKGKALLQQAADAGFSYANLNLAILKHQKGEAFLDNLTKARDAGNTIASLLLADYYLAQTDDPANMQQAQDIYQYLADKGDKEGQLKLGYIFDTGISGKQDHEQAVKWYLASAEQGQPIAQYLLGQLYQLGRIDKAPNYTEAKRWYAAAQNSYPKAAVALGFIYDTVEDNYSKALESYQLAAQKGDAIGEYDMALIYENGKGMPVNYAKAQELFTKSAERGFAQAMTQLASMYFTGQSGTRDEQRAFQLYKRAASLGEPDALYQLGLLSETGIATKLDFANAVNYYSQAAAKGNEKAKLALARMYQYGLGVNQDAEQAKRLYGELAVNNNAYAQYQLALILFNASPEHKSDEGKRLLTQASENGNLQARKMLQWLDAQQQDRISFIEPVAINQSPVLAGQGADHMYFDALSEWNRGDEDLSRLILRRLRVQFPQYVPAKRAYEQLNQHSSSFSVVMNLGGNN